jgi:hypothetical protein
MTPRMMLAVTAVALCVSRDAVGQTPAGPISPKPATVSSYEKVLTGLMERGSDDKLWDSLPPDARKQLVDSIAQLRDEIQKPVGPVAPKPPVGPVAPKPVAPPPQPGPLPGPAPSKNDFEKSLEALKYTLQNAKKVDPTYVLPVPANTGMQQLVEKLSTVKQ